MNDADYLLFMEDVCRRYDDETAARIIEDTCRGPYKPPLRIDVGQARAAARREAAGAETGGAA